MSVEWAFLEGAGAILCAAEGGNPSGNLGRFPLGGFHSGFHARPAHQFACRGIQLIS